MLVLAGDIGGTKTDLALFAIDGDALLEVSHQRLPSAAFADLSAMIASFLGAAPPSLAAAAFGVAGPVVGARAKATNLPWIVDAADLRAQLRIGEVCVVNDFHALALGVDLVAEDQRVILHAGAREPAGPRVIVGAGTGLGVAIVVPGGAAGPRVVASEGGHIDFAPRSEREIALLRFMLRRHHRVSIERLVSGPGLRALYEFVVEEGILAEDPEIRRRFTDEDPSAVIGEAAAAGDDAVSVAAAALFLELFGAVAGNLALTALPSGGLFVAGGVAPRLLPRLGADGFLAAYLDKGRMRPLLGRSEVTLIREPRVGLLGAASIARGLVARRG